MKNKYEIETALESAETTLKEQQERLKLLDRVKQKHQYESAKIDCAVYFDKVETLRWVLGLPSQLAEQDKIIC